MIKHSNNLFGKDSLAFATAKRSLSFFCLYYLQDIFRVKPDNDRRELSQVHYDIWDLLERMFIKNEIHKANIVVPRGCSKTTTCDLALTLYLHCFKISKFTVIGAKKEDDAYQFIGSVRTQLEENPYIVKTFGNLINAKKFTVNKQEIELTNKTCIKAVSSGSSQRGINWNGVRPTTFIADDFQDKNDVLTPQSREKKWKDWNDEVEELGDTAVFREGKLIKAPTKIISIGTILHSSCLISRLINMKDYITLLRSAIKLDPGKTIEELLDEGLWGECKKVTFDLKRENGIEEGYQFYLEHKEEMDFPILWEDKWDRYYDLALKYWQNRNSFMQEKMNDASKIGEKWFKSNQVQPKEEIEANIFKKTMLCVDCASTDTRRSDYFAFIVGSLSDNDFKYVRKGELLKIDARTEFDRYIKHVIDLLKEFPNITHIYIEKNTFNGVDAGKIEKEIMNDPDLSYRNIEIINEMQRKNKNQKISTITDSVNNGRVIFCAKRVQPEALEQLMDFSGQETSLHDDFVDCLSEFCNRIDDIEVVHKLEFMDIKKLF
ncbi:terminase [Desulfosporosinus youngiae]|uniref:Terminase-like family n=1 Tax=Desulfosporosinus youngiae DSM 17734 TaxID=768710 RepID=H5Y574_9FIRM|nr:terminase [Desulfosporosinus youngiae]EHQ90178.1 Terminase-like family [Desulfosporosinus youngiae DSM 17734]